MSRQYLPKQYTIFPRISAHALISAFPRFMPGRSCAADISADVAAGTAWATSRTNENMRRRQLEPSQSFTAELYCRVTFAGIEAVKTGMTNVAGHFYSQSEQYPRPSSNKRPSPPPSLSLIVGMQGKRSL